MNLPHSEPHSQLVEQHYGKSLLDSAPADSLALKLYERLCLSLRTAQSQVLQQPLEARKALHLGNALLHQLMGMFESDPDSQLFLQAHHRLEADLNRAFARERPAAAEVGRLLETAEALAAAWRDRLGLKRRTETPGLNVRRAVEERE